MPHLYIAAAHRSSGKTTLSIGLTRSLQRLGLNIQTFKKGPDYIDPLWLSRSTGRPCFNLDYHTMSRDEIRQSFARYCTGVDIGFIEGNVGLFDSVDLHGTNSNAELAKLLGAPVVLVVDVRGMTRGVAPLLLGYQAFDTDLNLAGVILNKVGGGRHAANLRAAVEHYTDIPVLGCVPRTPEIGIAERHLGLIPSNEAMAVETTIDRIASVIADTVDVERVAELAQAFPFPDWDTPDDADAPAAPIGSPVRIGIAQDDAFGFYYPDDLLALERAGAELVPFSPVWDRMLPEVDALFIGGGFPECRMEELEQNACMRAAVADFIVSGGPAYAECGGLMYLTERLHWNDKVARMSGVLDAEVAMHEKPKGRGYVRLAETRAFPWPSLSRRERAISAHEFHHSAIIKPHPDWVYGYEVQRGVGIDGRHDGVIQGNLLASYAHLRNVGGIDWTRRFVTHIQAVKAGEATA
jgi:cobyrinic acid a,c-diamide synthase